MKETLRSELLHSVARALATRVFPVPNKKKLKRERSSLKKNHLTLPGGPQNSKPRGGLRLNLAYTSPYISGNKTISFTIRMCFSNPPMQEKSFMLDIFLRKYSSRTPIIYSLLALLLQMINTKISLLPSSTIPVSIDSHCASRMILRSVSSLEFLCGWLGVTGDHYSISSFLTFRQPTDKKVIQIDVTRTRKLIDTVAFICFRMPSRKYA